MTPSIYYMSGLQNNSSPPTPPVEILMADGRIWDQKNLNVTSYRDGWPIPEVTSSWIDLTTGAWCWYQDAASNGRIYGRMYNWYAMMGIWQTESNPPTEAEIANRKQIAPIGWSVATEAEWLTLRAALGGYYVAGKVLKESGTSHWIPTNTGTNSTFFTALPGGYRNRTNSTTIPSTTFQLKGSAGYWLVKDAATTATVFTMTSTSNTLLRGINSYWIKRGSSIRLIKDSSVIPGFVTKYPPPSTITSTSLPGTGGYIPDNGEPAPTGRGIVYGLTSNPTILAPNITIPSGDGFGEYFIDITGLTALETYYIRAYVTLPSTGISYAEQVIAITASNIPEVSTDDVTEISTKTASCGGYVQSDGGLPLIARGVCWNTTGNPTRFASVATSAFPAGTDGLGPFLVDITNLQPNTKYYLRAFAQNSSATGYSEDQVEFTTLAVPSLNLIFNELDNIANHAYSLRRLSDTFTYKCLRVRRTTASPDPVTTTFVNVLFNSSDEIELDSQIVYVSGYPTAATTLGEFAASTGYENVDDITENQNIFITHWYDQSGNDKDVVQSSNTAQPRIVSSGSLELGARFSGGQILSLADSSALYNNESVYVVGSATSINTMNFYGQGRANVNARMFIGRAGGIWYNNLTGTNDIDFLIPQFEPNVTRLYELICGASITSAYTNGTQLDPFSVPSLNVTNTSIKIGAIGDPSIFSNGVINEVICLVGTPSIPLRTNIESNIMDYYEIPKPPLVTTADVNYIATTGTAIGGGDVTEDFGSFVTERGVCWNTFQNPTVDFGARTEDGQGVGSFISYLNFLSAYKQYYARAYAISSAGTSYGSEKYFVTGDVPAGLILDLFPSAHHAYSLRKLRTAYTGACLRIRRTTTSPNPVTTTSIDVSFDSNGTISFSSPLVVSSQTGTFTNAVNLGQFAQGTVDGLTAHSVINVVTWFDQSGNGKNLSATSAAQEPRLVRLDSGVATLETSGGKAAVRFLSTLLTRLTRPDTTINIGNMSSYFVGAYVTVTGIGYSIGNASPAVSYFPQSGGTNTWIGYGANGTAIQINEGPTTDRRLFELIAPSPSNASLIEGFANGRLKGTAALINSSSLSIVLGASATGTGRFDGYIQEAIGWEINTYRGEKEMNINNYWQIY